MKVNRSIGRMVLGIVGILMFASCAPAQEPQDNLTITDPAQAGAEVGLSKAVKGTASIPSGCHVWVLISPEDFDGQWWPQGEGVVNPKTRGWTVRVNFGQKDDVGRTFSVAAIVVDDQEHIKLKDYRKTAIANKDWPSIDMPPTVGAPQIIEVKKISHSN